MVLIEEGHLLMQKLVEYFSLLSWDRTASPEAIMALM